MFGILHLHLHPAEACPSRHTQFHAHAALESTLVSCSSCIGQFSRAAAIVFAISSSVCAALTNAASNCEGARYTPRSSIFRKNRPNRAVSHFFADSQSVTGPSVKKNVNIEPTRFTVTP